MNTGRFSRRNGLGARARVALEVLEASEARGFVIPHRRDGSVPYRGAGEVDYTCGRCGQLLAIGVPPGLFRRFVFSCACGALNQVPSGARATPLYGSAGAHAAGAEGP
ncbi:MAG TPA: hypothetical protein VMG32_02370 [Anaeromyxobacteraceae bacterium]|nr:hypothetical protein [Anaeromyxobacteraceae bacterium]